MSRYELPPLPEWPDVSVVAIGWDRPLQTFYVQVHARLEEDVDEDIEPVMVWLGSFPGELPTAAAALSTASRYGQVPDDLGARLELDRLMTVAERDGVSQRLANIWLSGPAD